MPMMNLIEGDPVQTPREMLGEDAGYQLVFTWTCCKLLRRNSGKDVH